MKTTIQIIVTVAIESDQYRLRHVDTVRPACLQAVEEALRRQPLSHNLPGTTLSLESVRPVVVHHVKVATQNPRSR